jgi:hypothetical protein
VFSALGHQESRQHLPWYVLSSLISALISACLLAAVTVAVNIVVLCCSSSFLYSYRGRRLVTLGCSCSALSHSLPWQRVHHHDDLEFRYVPCGVGAILKPKMAFPGAICRRGSCSPLAPCSTSRLPWNIDNVVVPGTMANGVFQITSRSFCVWDQWHRNTTANEKKDHNTDEERSMAAHGCAQLTAAGRQESHFCLIRIIRAASTAPVSRLVSQHTTT